MKTKLIKGKVDILLVDGLPKEARDFKYFNDKENPYMSYKLGVVVEREYAFPQAIEIHIHNREYNRLKQKHEILHSQFKKCMMSGTIGIINMEVKNIMIYFVLDIYESFQSLLQANDVLMENPYNEPFRHDAHPPLWQEAEAKVSTHPQL
jgi:hypothetical protein